eukprot:SAG22_NODE_604_length_8628_cov_4.245984_5_plen_501_part_00
MRDHVVSLYAVDELKAAHFRLVNSLRASRPAHMIKLGEDDTVVAREWGVLFSAADPATKYVRANAIEHIRQSGWNVDSSTEWLIDLPQDDITNAAAALVGADKLAELTDAAEVAGDILSCAKLAVLAGKAFYLRDGRALSHPWLTKAAEHLLQLSATETSVEVRDCLDRMEINVLATLFAGHSGYEEVLLLSTIDVLFPPLPCCFCSAACPILSALSALLSLSLPALSSSPGAAPAAVCPIAPSRFLLSALYPCLPAYLSCPCCPLQFGHRPDYLAATRVGTSIACDEAGFLSFYPSQTIGFVGCLTQPNDEWTRDTMQTFHEMVRQRSFFFTLFHCLSLRLSVFPCDSTVLTKDRCLQFLKFAHCEARGAATLPTQALRNRCMVLLQTAAIYRSMLDHATFDWDTLFGPDGAFCRGAMAAYDYEVMHPWVCRIVPIDMVVVGCVPIDVLSTHCGDPGYVQPILHSCLQVSCCGRYSCSHEPPSHSYGRVPMAARKGSSK